MKLFRSVSLFILFTCFSCIAFSQGKACKSNDLSFQCPQNLVVKSDGGSNGVFVAFDSKNKIGVFAFSPKHVSAEQDLIDEGLKHTLNQLYSTDLKDYQWKDSQDFSSDDVWSKFEVSKFAKAGLNKKKQHWIHTQYVVLSVKQKPILVGFVYEKQSNVKAESGFINWIGGGNGEATDNLQDLIVKITGEEKVGDSPGGPPPPAPTKKP